LLAQEMQVQGNGDVITARGAVHTVLYNTGGSTEARKIPVNSKSDQLVARRNDRRMELSGNVQIEDDTRTMTAEHAVFFFDANRKIDHIDADTKVTVVEAPTHRKMNGDKATYYVQKRMVYVNGAPATASDPTGSLAGEQIVLDITRNRMTVQSPGSEKSEIRYNQPATEKHP
ncbi:MAG TPA: LptA/OstA family protein, partial [Thermoanaerobaculia bacterium]